MNGPRQQQWQNILQMTEQLEVLSEGDNWLVLSELSVERQAKLDDFFSVEVSRDEAEEIATGIQQIMQSDEKLMGSSLSQQQKLSAEMKIFVTGVQAVKAYGDVQKG